MEIEVPESEVADRITILELKAARLHGAAARQAEARRRLLTDQWQRVHGALDDLPEVARLRSVNTQLWEVEDALRQAEAAQRFDATFVELARSVYRLNDERAALKRTIDVRAGSRWLEHKGFTRPG